MTMTSVLICKRNAQSPETVGSLLSNEFINVKQKWCGIGVSRYHTTFSAAELVEAEPVPTRVNRPSSLVPLKQIPRVHLVRHV